MFSEWLKEHWPGVLALALMVAGVWWMMPRRAQWPKVVGLLVALFGAFLVASQLHAAEGPWGEAVLFYTFAGGAIGSAIIMITNRNPVYSALWFALATLSVCGLFSLQHAHFLAAATVTVYAGAIVVTFVFVIMLAQQSGSTVYDQSSRLPLLATIAAFTVLGTLLATLHKSTAADFDVGPPASAVVTASSLSRLAPVSDDHPLGEHTMRDLGRSLFGEYLFAVELAGTLLLVATIGAIAIAPRRSRGTL